jgi:hypothetical protein
VRVSAGQLRDLVRTGASWRPPPGPGGGASPASARAKAIGIYHDEGHVAAVSYLAGNRGDGSKGLAGAFGVGGRYANWGARTRDSLDRYFRYDQQQGEVYAALPLRGEVTIGTHTVGAYVDVVMFHRSGYVGRLLNWDLEGVTLDDAELMAAPASLLIEQELGRTTCVKIAVWDLEHRRQFEVNGAYALAQVGRVRRLMDRVDALS